jgi:fructokinase
VFIEQNFKGSVSGFAVKTIDTTGAGDAFVGSLLVSIAKDTLIFEVGCITSEQFQLGFFYFDY